MALPIPRSTRQQQPATGSARRWDPFWDVEGLYDRMNQFMQNVMGDLPTLPAVADIEETDDAFLVEIDLPGVKSDDINVEVRENQLRISGEFREKERVGVLRRQNRQVGRFDYTVAVPGEIDPDKVDGTLSDGVLTVRLGKASKSQPRRIEIKSS